MTTPNSHPAPPAPEHPLPSPVILTPDPNPPSPWQRWKNFWFPKSDPTTLGFIRLTTGLLVLYIHIAYSVDLQAFFGKQAWYASTFIDRERHEGPSYIQPFFGDWKDEFSVTQLSEYPHRRQAFMDFLRGLPADATERRSALKYLNRINQFQNADDFRRAIFYIQSMKSQPEKLEYYLAVLTDTKLEKESLTEAYRQTTPPLVSLSSN